MDYCLINLLFLQIMMLFCLLHIFEHYPPSNSQVLTVLGEFFKCMTQREIHTLPYYVL